MVRKLTSKEPDNLGPVAVYRVMRDGIAGPEDPVNDPEGKVGEVMEYQLGDEMILQDGMVSRLPAGAVEFVRDIDVVKGKPDITGALATLEVADERMKAMLRKSRTAAAADVAQTHRRLAAKEDAILEREAALTEREAELEARIVELEKAAVADKPVAPKAEKPAAPTDGKKETTPK